MRVLIFVFLVISTSCFGQEMPSPCDVVMVDYPHASILVSSSNNGNFLVRLEQDKKTSKPKAFFFEWHDKSYLLVKEILLNHGFPNQLMVSDSGSLVFIGKKNAKSNIDEINIYSKNKGLVKTIESTRKDYSSEPENCQLRKPWVCWHYPININGENLNLLDLSGNEIDIDLTSGRFTQSKSVDACEDYH